MFAEFYKNSKVVSSDFTMVKNIVAPCAAKSLSIKLICCGYFQLFYLLKSIAVSLYFFFEIHKLPVV